MIVEKNVESIIKGLKIIIIKQIIFAINKNLA
jgi:hypothetical protein